MAAARRSCAGLASLALVAACAAPPDFVVEDAAPAFPNRRPVFPTEGRLLGYATNGLDDTISVVDLDAMTLLGSPPIGRDPVDTDGPTSLAIDRAHGLLYVALSYPTPGGGGPHAAHNGATRAGYVQALALDDLRPLGELRVDRSPGALVLSDGAVELAVSHEAPEAPVSPTASAEEQRAALLLIRPAWEIAVGAPDVQVQAQVRRITVCVSSYAIVLEPARGRAYVACTGEDALAVVDVERGSVVARVPAGDESGVGKPYALVTNPARTQLLLSNRVLRKVVLFTMEDLPLRLFTSAPLAGVPYFATWLSEREILVPTQSPSGAVVFDAYTGDVLREIAYSDEACAYPREARRSQDGRVFLLCEGDHFQAGAVVRIDPATLAVVSRVTVGIAPDRLAVLEP